ncbi:MAG: hypothetical protein EOO88_62955 [Pedobacter sp.]|nr:MAG: hypothetical protein EOO88_62955 [Pedobacter sp.]
MHTGVFRNLQTVINHYNVINIAPANTRLDPKLRPNNIGQKLNLTPEETDAVVAFLRTMSGNNLYTDKKWGSPFK